MVVETGDGDGLGKPGRRPGIAATACTVNDKGKLPEQACIPEIRSAAFMLLLEERPFKVRANRNLMAEARYSRICSCVSIDTSDDKPSDIIRKFTSSIDMLSCTSASVDASANEASV